MTQRRASNHLALAGLAFLSACASGPAPSRSVPPPSLRQEMEEGEASWFLNAASSLKLDYQQQQALLSAGQTVRAASQPVSAARRRLLSVLADGIAAGSFDQGKIDAELQEITTAAKARGPAVSQALQTLHDALTPDQRQTLAGSVNIAAYDSNARFKAEREQLQRRVDSVTVDLGMTPAQDAQVRSELLDNYKTFAPDLKEEAQARAKQLAGLSKAFAQPAFYPFAMNESAVPDLEAKSRRLIAFVEKFTALLTPSQRPRAAAVLRQQENLD